jgi:ubiquinone biosynthesis protein
LIELSRRHRLHMPSPLALLLKTMVMAEGIGQQIDPQLDVFGVARPYAERALARQWSVEQMTDQARETLRNLGEASFALPHQVGDVLQRLEDSRLTINTREEELGRVAHALIGAANRLAVALVLMAQIIALGLLGVAVGVGGWQGVLPLTLAIGGGVSVLVTSLVLLYALLRGRNA